MQTIFTSKKRKPDNPHLWPCWYPKSKRFYWRCTPTPKPYNLTRLEIYRKANNFKEVLNRHHSIQLFEKDHKMHTSKKKHKHTPHIWCDKNGKLCTTLWGDPFITKDANILYNKAKLFAKQFNNRSSELKSKALNFKA